MVSSARSICVLLAFLALGLVGTAHADLESTKDTLMSCIKKHMANERAKDRPSTDALLATCSTEYQAFMKVVPPKLVSDVKHDLRHQLDDYLAK